MFKFDLTIENLERGLSNPFQFVDEILLQHVYRVPSTLINARRGIGSNVFSQQWDLLIILDCCRVDALREVAPEYDFIDTVGSVKTNGGSTPEWIANTFTRKYVEEIRKTTYLTSTAQIRGMLEERLPAKSRVRDTHIAYKLLQYCDTVDIEDLERVEYLFKYEPKGEVGPLGHPQGATPPRYVTDRAIWNGRNRSPDRLLLHYIQPHPPYAAMAIGETRDLEDYEDHPLRYLRYTGEFDTVWAAYLDELRYVLDDVELLLDNIDAEKVVLTADHGEAFGEYGIYGHTVGSLHPMVRKVPWAVTSASDAETYEPQIPDPNESEEVVDSSTEEMLRALGYKH